MGLTVSKPAGCSLFSLFQERKCQQRRGYLKILLLIRFPMLSFAASVAAAAVGAAAVGAVALDPVSGAALGSAAAEWV